MSHLVSVEFDAASRALFERARIEAIRLNHSYIGAHHLILALVAQTEGSLPEILTELSVDAQRIRAGAAATAGRPPASPIIGDIPFTSRGKQALNRAIVEARLLNAPNVGPEHILLGVLNDADSYGANLVASQGITLELARHAVRKLQAGA